MSEDEVAALDGDWSDITPKERAAFAFCRKFTFSPHELNDKDITNLKAHYTEKQILEMILSMAGNNAINRWKEGAGIPQSSGGGGFGARNGEPASDKPHSYVTPTAEKYLKSVTQVAPWQKDLEGKPTTKVVAHRPPLESRTEVEKLLKAAEARTPRLLLADLEKSKAVVPEGFPTASLPQWVRLLANFSTQGKNRIASQWSAETKGTLSPLLKAQISWILARQDRAWYAAGLARHKLRKLGQTDDQIFALDGDWSSFPEKDRALFAVARQLAASPIVLTDEEAATAVKLNGTKDVVQVVHYTTIQASFNRITEAAGLSLAMP